MQEAPVAPLWYVLKLKEVVQLRHFKDIYADNYAVENATGTDYSDYYHDSSSSDTEPEEPEGEISPPENFEGLMQSLRPGSGPLKTQIQERIVGGFQVPVGK